MVRFYYFATRFVTFNFEQINERNVKFLWSNINVFSVLNILLSESGSLKERTEGGVYVRAKRKLCCEGGRL